MLPEIRQLLLNLEQGKVTDLQGAAKALDLSPIQQARTALQCLLAHDFRVDLLPSLRLLGVGRDEMIRAAGEFERDYQLKEVESRVRQYMEDGPM
jgi:hypothetical protein